MRALSAMLAVLAAAQDGPGEERIRRLLSDLEHDDVAIRERAERELEEAGETAALALRRILESAEGAQNELTLRAAAVLRKIERAAKIRAAVREPALLRLCLRDAELRAVLAEIERQAGVRFADLLPAAAPARVTLEANGRPLLAVLDELGRQTGLSYRWEGEGTLRLLPETPPSCPAAYPGPFRVRAADMRLERRTDFKNRTVSLRVLLAADHDRSLQTVGPPSVSLRKARDDRGSNLEIRAGAEKPEFVAGAGQAVVRVAVGRPGAAVPWADAATETHQEFILSGLAPGASKIWLEGTVRCALALETRDIHLPAKAGAQANAGDIQIQAKRKGGRPWMLTFTPTRGEFEKNFLQAIIQHLLEESLVAVDVQGKEYKAMALVPQMEFPGNGREVSFQVIFQVGEAQEIREIRFKFVTDMHIHELPFALEAVELP